MMNYDYQHKHVQGFKCPECGEKNEIFYDTHHVLIYCKVCDLVLYEF